MNLQYINKQNGFTLIELLVVIAIIGILSSVVLASLSGARESARDTRRQQDIRQIKTALEMYYNDNGEYPPSTGATVKNGSWSSSVDSSWDTLESELSGYIDTLPEDPINTTGDWADASGEYNYNYFSQNYGCDQEWYMIVYRLENPPTQDEPGVTACDGSSFEYGGPAVRTVGVSG